MQNEILSCSPQSFMETYRPFKPTKRELNTCSRALERRPSLLSNGKWVEWSDSPQHSESRNAVYDLMEEISGRLKEVDLDAANTSGTTNTECELDGIATLDKVSLHGHSDSNQRRHSTVQWTLGSAPKRTMPGEPEDNENKVDGYFSRVVPESGAQTLDDVSVLCTFTKDNKSKEVVHNRILLVSSALHILNQDPVRKAVYGITIENGEASLWYFCRSHSAKSEPFSIASNPMILIEVMLWFMFAHNEAVGFDPDVRRVHPPPDRPNDPPSYVYWLYGEDDGQSWERYYRTTRPLYARHEPCIIGRATRVWEAHRVASFTDMTRTDDKTVVLREAWIDVGTQTERQLQESIFSDLHKFGQKLAEDSQYQPLHFSMWNDKLMAEVRDLFSSSHSNSDGTGGLKKRYQDYFLTIVCDSLGDPCKDVASGCNLRNDILREVVGLPSGKGKCASTNKGAGLVGHSPKRPYRLIYGECCHDLEDDSIRSLQEIFTGLRDCFLALVLLYCAGWVHRDVSCGNVLLWRDLDDKVHGKLGDLEYAQRFPSSGSTPDDSRTGTAFFMPVEVSQGYHFMPKPTVKQPKTTVELFTERESVYGVTELDDEPIPTTEPVQYNFLHDLEGLFWLVLWSITYRLGHYEPVFVPLVNDFVTAKRFRWLNETYLIPRALEAIPSSVDNVKKAIGMARQFLSGHYRDLSTPDKRRDIANHSFQYNVMRNLVFQPIPHDAPPLSRIDAALDYALPEDPSTCTQSIGTSSKRAHENMSIQ